MTTSQSITGSDNAYPGDHLRGRVGISLMLSSDTTAAVEYIEATHPDATIDFRGVFYKIQRRGRLTFDMDAISECAGRDIDTGTFLVNMSSYYGNISVSGRHVDIVADVSA
jgi:hypothetical protein